MSKVNPAALLAAFFALVNPVGAQNPQSTQAGGQPGTAIHATVNEVALDLVVRDKKGKLVKNLTPADVQIYEDGVRQQIRSFRLVAGETAPPKNQPQDADAEVSAPKPLPDVNLVCVVFHNLDSNTRRWAVSASKEFIDSHLHGDTWMGVFNLSSQLTPLVPFTTNRDDLLKAANNAFFGMGSDITRAADAVLNATPNVQLIAGYSNGAGGGMRDLSTTGSVNMNVINGADVDNSPASNNQRGDLVLEREQFIGVEGAKQVDQIKAMIRQFSRFPGHKAVLLFSAGLTTTGDAEQFQAVLDKANQADISVYAFDANGLSEISSTQAGTMAMQHVAALSQQQGQSVPGVTSITSNVGPAIGTAGYNAELSRQDDYNFNAVRTSDPKAALRFLSEGTGGFMAANTNDLRKSFDQVAAEVGTHYEADYNPTSDKYDGHFRKIEVKLAHADWRADFREGYFALPDSVGPLRPFEMTGLMALNASPRPRAFDFQTAAYQFRPGTSSQSAVVFEFPGSALTATPLPQMKRHRLHASLFAVVKDSSGQVVDTFGQDFLYAVPDDQMANVQSTPIDYRHAFDLPAGHYTVESVVVDREAQRASTSTVELDSPELKGVALSSLMLIARADPLTTQPEPGDPLVFQTKELVPMLNPSLKASAQPMLYFVVYPDQSIPEKPRVRVEFSVGGEAVAQKQSELSEPDADGAIPVLVNAATKPGDCEIKITAVQGLQTTTRTLKYTVAAQ